MNMETLEHRSGKHSRGATGQGFLSAYWSAISFPSFPILTSIPFWLPVPDHRLPVTELDGVNLLLFRYTNRGKMVLKLVVVMGSQSSYATGAKTNVENLANVSSSAGQF